MSRSADIPVLCIQKIDLQRVQYQKLWGGKIPELPKVLKEMANCEKACQTNASQVLGILASYYKNN